MNLLITAVSSATAPSSVCRHAYNLVRCAANRKEVLQVTLAVGKWQTLYFHRLFKLHDSKINVISVGTSNNALARHLWHLHDLPHLAQALAIDVIHLSFPVPIRRSSLPCPVLVSLHDLKPCNENDSFGFPANFFNRVFLHHCLMEVDCVACVSESMLSRLTMRFPRIARGKAVVVNNCTTLQFNDLVRPAGLQSRFVLVVAQHPLNKGISLALEAFAELLRKKKIEKETLLLVIGNHGPETTAIRSDIKQRTLESKVQLVTEVNEGELRWLYENCEVLIVPSLTEGYGVPVLEGLLCGSRVVCSDITDFREIGGRSCHYFDLHAKSQSAAMITAVCNALAEPARPAERAERFSTETAGREYLALYAHLKKMVLSNVEDKREAGCAIG
jgi:glycosyltransferase involved in cell wall biosynthesis